MGIGAFKVSSLVNFSTKTEYAIRAVLDLTLEARSEPVRIADIANRQRIPQKFLETILAELKRDGILESRRGAEGGYLLARSPDLITVGQVVRTIEGGRTARGSMGGQSPLDDLWREVDSSIGAVLDRKSFAELAREWRERQASYVPNWEI